MSEFMSRRLPKRVQETLDTMITTAKKHSSWLPGFACMAETLNHEDVIRDEWLANLGISFNKTANLNYSLELSSYIQKSVPGGKRSCFFRLKTCRGIERHVFKDQQVEKEKLWCFLAPEFKGCGKDHWPFNAFFVKARGYLFENARFEVDIKSDKECSIIAMTDSVLGYFILDFYLLGDHELQIVSYLNEEFKNAKKE